MGRTATDARRWAAAGTALVDDAVRDLSDDGVQAPSALPGWTVGQLLAHVAANADALLNLVRWASTGVETPMYASAQARDAAIERARDLGADDLRSWFAASSAGLAAGLDALTDEQWQAEVTTIQGRTLPATEIPWLRAREVCVHAVDLGRAFADLPADFLEALVDDICLKRGLTRADLPAGALPNRLPDVAAWLADRPHGLAAAPDLGPWL
jgi:maleylpyruvate isomerase